MQSYEAVVILTQKMSDEEVTDNVAKLSELISKTGELVSVDDWKTKKLAYEIKHETEGHYYLFTFNASSTFIAEFERVLRINAGVLKHMVIRKI